MKRKIIIIAICVILAIKALVIGLVFGLKDNNTNGDNNGETSPPTDTNEPKPNYTVTFLNDDKSIFKQVTVVSGEAPVSPGVPTMLQGYLFDGWDADLSSITKDMTVLPLSEKISNDKTVIALSDGYGVTGNSVSVPITLCGKVNVCCFEIKITYDKSLLQFIEFSNEDSGITVNCDSENGIIYLNYISTQNTTGQVDLCDATFKLIATNDVQIPLNITVDIAVKITENDSYEKVDCDVRNGEIDLIGR